MLVQKLESNKTKPIPVGPHYKIRAGLAGGLKGVALWNAVVDPMIHPLTPLDGTARLRRILSKPQYAVYALLKIDADFENAGLWWVYISSSRGFTKEGVGLLRYVGAPQHAAVLARANRVPLPKSKDFPAALGNPQHYDAEDDAWYRADANEGAIDTIIARFIRAHPRAFFY